MKRCVLSRRARLDIHNIWDYIAKDNVRAADSLIAEIRLALDQIEEFPAIGHIKEEVAPSTLRFWRVQSFLIAYREKSNVIEVVRVISGYRDLSGLFR